MKKFLFILPPTAHGVILACCLHDNGVIRVWSNHVICQARPQPLIGSTYSHGFGGGLLLVESEQASAQGFFCCGAPQASCALAVASLRPTLP